MSLPSRMSGLRHSKLATPRNASTHAVRVCHPTVSMTATARHAAQKSATSHHEPMAMSSENRSGKKLTSSERGMIPSSVKNAVRFGKSCQNQLKSSMP